jgi:hypothetical protein
MKNERILSYNMSQKLTEEDLESISAAGISSHFSGTATCGPHAGCEGSIDFTIDP